MSYTIGTHHDGGYDYTITVNGIVTKGWRHGSRKDVETHVRSTSELWEGRANNNGLRKYWGWTGRAPRSSGVRGRRKKAARTHDGFDTEEFADADSP